MQDTPGFPVRYSGRKTAIGGLLRELVPREPASIFRRDVQLLSPPARFHEIRSPIVVLVEEEAGCL
jgi:hypothetical protein